MAATNSTAGYNLPLFTDDDKPTWLGDFNEAMERIDAAIAQREAASNLLTTQLNAQVEALTNANAALAARVTVLENA